MEIAILQDLFSKQKKRVGKEQEQRDDEEKNDDQESEKAVAIDASPKSAALKALIAANIATNGKSVVQDMISHYKLIMKLPKNKITAQIRDIHKLNVNFAKMTTFVKTDSGAPFANIENIIKEYNELRDNADDSSEESRDIRQLFSMHLFEIERQLRIKQNKFVNAALTSDYKLEDVGVYRIEDAQIGTFKEMFPHIPVFKINPWLVAVASTVAMIIHSSGIQITKVQSLLADNKLSTETEVTLKLLGTNVLNYKITMIEDLDAEEDDENADDKLIVSESSEAPRKRSRK